MRQGQIIQNLRQFGSGNEGLLQTILQREKNFFGFFRLIEEEAADSDPKRRFGRTRICRRDMSEPRQSGIAIAPGEISLPDGKRGLWPFRFEPGFAHARIVITGEQSADVMFERIQTQRALQSCEIGKIERKTLIVGREQLPDQRSVRFH